MKYTLTVLLSALSLFSLSDVHAASGDVCTNTVLSTVSFSVGIPTCGYTLLSTQTFRISATGAVVVVPPAPVAWPTIWPGGGGGGGGGSSASNILAPQATPPVAPVTNTSFTFSSAPTLTTPKKFTATPLFDTVSIFAGEKFLPKKSVVPTYFPATGKLDWSDSVLAKAGFSTYDDNAYVSTKLPYWSRVFSFAIPFSERLAELPKTSKDAPMYVSYDAVGIFTPVYVMANQDKEPVQREYLDVLKSGAVHLVGTGFPEDDKSDPITIVGHSASLASENAGHFAAIFKTLPLAKQQDNVTLYTKNTDGSYTEQQYKVVEIRKNVKWNDMSIIEDNKGRDVIQLVTCYFRGRIGALDGRIVVVAEKIK